MIAAANAVIWINSDTRQVKVLPQRQRPAEDVHWADPIGAAYSQWAEMNDDDRVRLMMETALDLAMQGFPLKDILIAFAGVKEFRALGSQSYPMCRALTSAMLGICLEPNTMSFEELLVAYMRPPKALIQFKEIHDSARTVADASAVERPPAQ